MTDTSFKVRSAVATLIVEILNKEKGVREGLLEFEGWFEHNFGEAFIERNFSDEINLLIEQYEFHSEEAQAKISLDGFKTWIYYNHGGVKDYPTEQERFGHLIRAYEKDVVTRPGTHTNFDDFQTWLRKYYIEVAK